VVLIEKELKRLDLELECRALVVKELLDLKEEKTGKE
jgi:hypothetical protein